MWHRNLQDLPSSEGRLVWVDLDHAGRVAFTKALQAAMSDQAWQPGSWEAARAHFDTLQQGHYDPDWWRLGYLEQKVAAVVVPQRIDTVGTIGFFGVLPQWRGEGLGREVLLEGLRVLADAGLTEVRVSIESEPGIRVLKACGFQDRGSNG